MDQKEDSRLYNKSFIEAWKMLFVESHMVLELKEI